MVFVGFWVRGIEWRRSLIKQTPTITFFSVFKYNILTVYVFKYNMLSVYVACMYARNWIRYREFKI